MILFDAVGTLIYPDPPVAQVYGDAGRRNGASLSTDEVAARFARALTAHANGSLISNDEIELRRWRSVVGDVFRELPTAGEQLFDDLWLHFAQPEAWRVYDDVEGCLYRLKSDGYRLGVASNFDARLPSVVAGHPALSELELFYSSDLGFAKPHTKFFAAIEQRLGTNANQITLVGDDVDADFEGAIAAGWTGVLLDRNEQAGCQRSPTTINSLSQLPKLLAEANRS